MTSQAEITLFLVSSITGLLMQVDLCLRSGHWRRSEYKVAPKISLYDYKMDLFN